MSTLTDSRIELNRSTQKERSSVGKLARRIGWIVLSILGGLVALVSMLPVALLPFATGVPWLLCALVALADVGLLIFLFGWADTVLARTGVIVALVVVAAGAVLLSQQYATTPAIVDAEGQPLPGSIAELTQVELNGSQQWISLRGHDQTKPIMLFLAGGPGGSQLPVTRRSLARLEESFVVVNWEQPGAGKSFNAVDRSTLTPERYINDAHALITYLQQRFDQEKIYVMGESWGSALGILLVQRYPELFHAFIGTGQMVAFLDADLICYDFALDLAQERGDTQKVQALRKQGPPPYYGDGMAMKQVAYLADTYAYMNQMPEIPNPGFDTFRDLAGPEYGLVDKVAWVLGPVLTLGQVYPQLWDIDFRTQATQLDVPVYFLIGRHDVNAPVELTEEYYNLLSAPKKELIWFEESGHSPWTSEPDAFVDTVVNTVLAQTAP